MAKRLRKQTDEGPNFIGIDLGSYNYFGGAIGDIAGRDITKHTYINETTTFNIQFPLESAQLLKEERNYCASITNSLDIVSKKFVPTSVVIEVYEDMVENRVPSDFVHTVAPNLIGLLNSKQGIGTYTFTRKKIRKHIDTNEIPGLGTCQVTGALGTGKTSILLMLTYSIADNFLSNTNIPMNNGTAPSSFYGQQRLPLFLDLRNNSEKLPLAKFAKQAWNGYSLSNWFKMYLENGKICFLIDGIDDLPSAEKIKTKRELKGIIAKGNTAIVASRQFDSQISTLEAVTEPFDDDQIKLLFSSYLGPTGSEELWHLISNDFSPLKQWLCVPLLAFIVAFIYELKGHVFENIESLIQSFISIVLERDIERKAISKMDQTNFVKQLSNLAFGLVSQEIGNEFTSTYLSQIGFPRKNMKRALEIGVIEAINDGNSFRFLNAFVHQYFVGNKLLDLIKKSPKEFDATIQSAITERQIPVFKRSSLPKHPTDNEAHWDTVLPSPPKSKWHDALNIMLISSSDKVRRTALSRLIRASCETASDLIMQNNLFLDDALRDLLINQLLEHARRADVPKRTRIGALRVVGVLGDPRIGDSAMVHLPGGDVEVGPSDSCHPVKLSPFWIDIYPVTNQQYALFMKQKGYETRKHWSDAGWDWLRVRRKDRPTFWNDPRYNLPNYPVVGVSWYEADAYSKWAGKRLPTEAEWEAVSTWGFKDQKKRRFPSGNVFFDDIGNLFHGEYVYNTTPVGAYPRGQSVDGVFDLVGNVWEWLSSEFKDYPYKADDGREEIDGIKIRCLRGGSWGLDQVPGAICTERYRANSANDENATIGFRCAKSP